MPTQPIGPAGRSWLSANLWWLSLAVGFVLVLLLNRYDAGVAQAISADRLPGDVRRELHAWQQYGQGTATVMLCLVVWLMDPRNRPRLFDYGLCIIITGAAVSLLKGLIGRPRPKYNDPETFLGPLGMYPVTPAGRTEPFLAHAWDITKPISSDLWSMPSSHTAFAVLMSVFIVWLYPRLAIPAVFLAAVVAFARLLFDAHWMTDVIAGAAIAISVGSLVMGGRWISRRLESRYSTGAARAD
ncbi:MAG: phosphatase PAP2 family protein [Phycisphaerales bacterium]|jgi:membrane-associated phospholipid phosphatase|nr:phosphatase PAP2 family protein [Phycisphaeraceae bacterium]